MQVDVVSATESLYSGEAKCVFAPASTGELAITQPLHLSVRMLLLVMGQLSHLLVHIPLGLALLAPIIKSSKPSPLTSPALETE
jgi:hypothetical protein